LGLQNVEPLKFPIIQEIMDFKHYRHPGGKKKLLETVE